MLQGFSGHLVGEAFLAGRLSLDDRSAERRILSAADLSLHRLGPSTVPRTLLEAGLVPVLEKLGHNAPEELTVADGVLVAVLRDRGRPIVVLVPRWGERLDAYWRPAVVAARRHQAAWCLLFNGITLRLVDARRVYSRRVVDFDLPIAVEREDSSAALRLLMDPAALFGEPGDPRSLHGLVAQSDRHASGVCRSLRDGVLAASADILGALVARRRPAADDGVADGFEQALTIVYRILFLLFAEARSLVPLWHRVYRDSYSIESLRQRAELPGRAPGLWDALRAIARLAHAGCRAGDLHVTPFNGRLFAPARTPLAERRDLDDDAARRAILALSTRAAADRAGRERIAYRDLGVEQLGAVYETLLDYRPVLVHSTAAHGRAAPTVKLETGSGARKATGTFYTPEAIASHLVRRTLAPLVRGRSPADILDLRVVDPAMGSGAFLVAACRYLSAAYEQALVDSGDCHPRDIDERDRVGFRRAVAERCLYGVDLNPMAVQLARLSLWLATLAADRPLSFLDHRLLAGDSLLGAWLTTLRRPPSRHRRSTVMPSGPTLFDDDAAVDALRDALPVRFSLESPNDTLEQVRAKERALTALTRTDGELSRWKRVGDLWCAAWFANGALAAPNVFGSLADAILGGQRTLPAHTIAVCLDEATAIARTRHFFHWELEFPEVFFDADGGRRTHPGFDAVIGNPPWDMIRADAGPADARERLRDDAAAVVRFTRDAGIYAAQSSGHANRYQLFVERVVALARAGGRLGLVLPSGLATDHGSASLRRLLFSRSDIDALVGIDNQRGIFPIHRSMRFLLVTATAGPPTRSIGCRFGIQTATELDSLSDDAADRTSFPLQLSTAALERLSGPSLAVPHLRSPIDLAIAEKAAALFPPLGAADGWNARFGRELNATEDRRAFRAAGRGLPVVDGKHVEPFRVAVGRSARSISVADATRLLGREHVGRPRLAYRDVASATNRVTLIAAILPKRCVSTHTVFCLRTPLPLEDQQFLCGLFNSLVVNYLVRLRVTTHVTTGIVEHLPIPVAEAAAAARREIAALARRLRRGSSTAAFVALNVRAAALYQLTREELTHVLDSFPLVARADRDAVLTEYRASG